MSEISVLSDQYKRLAKTSDRINKSIIALKKRKLVRDQKMRTAHPKLALSEEQYRDASADILAFLENLRHLIKKENRNTEDLPVAILDNYLQKLNESQYFEEELAEVIADIKKEVELDEKDMRVLDLVISVLDNERTLLFRKLRTARG